MARNPQARQRALSDWPGLSRVAVVGTIGLWLLVGCGRAPSGPADGDRLPRLPIDPATVTVSGISSGANMATQFHVAHSGLVAGAGLFAGSPYDCAEGSIRHSLGRCMKGDDPIPVDELVETTSRFALDGAIDPISGLADDRVWIFHGARDPYVQKPVVDALEAYYRALVDPSRVARVELGQAGHTFPSARADAKPCDLSEPPFVGRCDFDGAGRMLAHLYGEMQPGRPPGPGELVEFDQRPYARAASSVGLARSGWLFVPKECSDSAEARCRLHVVFHGCKQGASIVGREFILGSGYLEAAAANRTVLLFPQVERSFMPLNPYGCWDWWGYEGDDYALRAGAQQRAVRLMIGDLLGEHGG